MAPAESTKTEGSCCHRSVVQFVEIKNELKNIRQTVDLAVKLLSKLVGLAPNDIQAMANNGVCTPTSLPVMDCLANINSTSDCGLRRDTAKEPMDITVKQVAFTEAIYAKVETAVKAKNGKTFCENYIDKITVEAGNLNTDAEIERNKANEAKNDETTVESGNDKGSVKVKGDKIPQVNRPPDSFSSLSDHLTTFVKTNLATTSLLENPAVNISKDCATVSGKSVTSDCHTVVINSDLSVCAVQSGAKDKKTDTALQPDALHHPSMSKMTGSNMLPAACDIGVSALNEVCTDSANPKTVVTNTGAGLNVVKVKQEQPSEYDDTDMSVFAKNGEEKLQQTEDVKMDPEGVFISDAMLPVCVLVKKEDGCVTNNSLENSTTSCVDSNNTGQLSGQNTVVNTGDKLLACSDPPNQVSSPLRPLLGSALVSKLKQKIQEKIQAAVYAINEERKGSESQNDNLANTNKCIEIPHSFNKDSTDLKELMATQSKFRQKFYQCKSCAKIFFCKVALCVHKKRCRGLQKQYHCSFCPLIFKSRAVLFIHQQLHSAKKTKGRHKCEICGREFILKSTLRKHRQSQVCKGSRMKCYRKLPQYFCGECGQGFLNSTNLELHQKLHRVDKVDSSRRVEKTNTGNRGTPVVVSRTARRYPCSYCNEAFIDRRSVTLHEKLHTDKEFAAFDEERKMIQRRHQLTMMLQKQQQQSNRKKFGCDVCGRCYSIELLLHMHTRLHHAIS